MTGAGLTCSSVPFGPHASPLFSTGLPSDYPGSHSYPLRDPDPLFSPVLQGRRAVLRGKSADQGVTDGETRGD